MEPASPRRKHTLRAEAERLHRLMEEAARSEEPGDSGEVHRMLAFVVGGRRFALPLARLEEVIAPPPTVAVPFAEPHVTGICAVRGEIVPVLDLRRVLGVRSFAPGDRARILVVGRRSERVGLLVDAVAEVRRFESAEIQPCHGEGDVPETFLRGAVRDGDQAVLVLDLDGLLSALRG